ncbi:MAG: gfo/Idh/MocA family oxidoreductase [Calditrichaeota bacterium]|nr:MAG: gfo/Idh/MocA family oxidoreductase [Calditrichota bacterium]
MKRHYELHLLFFCAVTLGFADTQPRAGRVGIIGLDTSHSVEFTKLLNDTSVDADLDGYRVVAAFPFGSRDITSSASRIPQYTETVKAMGVKIVDSIEELLAASDVILLETNDGRPHLQQALKVIESGKPLFVDKPVAAELAHVFALYQAAAEHQTPIFSASSLRYMEKAQAIRLGAIGVVVGAETYSPAFLEPTHPDLYWYGIHGVELLYTVMGTGCERVMRASSAGSDVVIGVWENGRIGTFRGLRDGHHDYGGTAFGTDRIEAISPYEGYRPLLVEIVRFFRSGVAPISPEETLEIYTFMTAADISKQNNGSPIMLRDIWEKAANEAEELLHRK